MNIPIEKYQQILSYLIINSGSLTNLGLFHGKMGIVLFFSFYARATQSKHYEDFAGYLLDELYEDIHKDLPINLENGLCGIGWGIEYLVQQGFMEGSTDEILADIDRKVMEIDPLRISDLSFRHGLAGIVFYVIARLNSQRANNTLPFDKTYLISLQQAISSVQFSDADEAPEDIKESFEHVLHGEMVTLSIPRSLNHSNLTFEQQLNDISLGLENGLAGWAWDKLHKISFYLHAKKEKLIVLFDEESRSTKYGIGAYINQLIHTLQAAPWQIIRIRIFADIKEALTIQQEENAIYINIAGLKTFTYHLNDIKRYYQRIVYVLYPYFKNVKSLIFHLNTMQCEVLAKELKKHFPQSPLLLTVHYTNWGLELLGNRIKLETILKSPDQKKFQPIYESFKSEKQLMQICDQIIVIAQHSYNDIITLYQIPKEKVTLIPHGLHDAYLSLSKEEKINRRKKYGFSEKEQILIFAGRVDPIKGVEYLAKAFTLLVEQYPNLRLIIVGDGDFNSIFSQLNPNWSQLTCTGFVEKSILYELISISDIGVLPSLREEFGLVALEMMMMKLPLVVGDTTGLAELVQNKISGVLVPIQKEHPSESVSLLKSAIESLLNDRDAQMEFANIGRSNFLQRYTLSVFRKNMLSFYERLEGL